MSRFTKLWWWLWLSTGVALAASLAGWARGLRLAIVLTIAQVVEHAMQLRPIPSPP